MIENQNIEFKQSWRDEFLKVISAFTNSDGGIIYLGVDDRGNTVGLDNRKAKKLLEDLPNKIKNRLGITAFVTVEEKEGKKIIRIEVPKSHSPVSYEGKFYIRTGTTTQELSGLELSSFLLEKAGDTWDSLPSNANFNELDIETIKQFKNLAKQKLPLVDEDSNLEILLKKLKLITDDNKITNAGVMLFSKNPQKYFINAYTKIGRFKDDITILDTVIVEGNLFKQLDEGIAAIKKHLNVRFDTSVKDLSLKGVARKEIWDYPLEAIREALINALIHRDYLDNTKHTQIKIYDDKIIFWNAGKLISPLTIEKLKENHIAIQRNPLIASVFYYANLIEAWGSGTTKIINLCKSYGLPEPNFKEYREGLGLFEITFYKDIYNEENLRKMGLNERQIKAVLYVKEKGKITNKEYQELNKVSDRTATRDLVVLVNKNIFDQIGTTGKGTNYILRRHKDAKGVIKTP
ncbi:MAG: Divergent AAA domain protein [candidate division TA06 bacterium ADurb.Bin131]|uniref:Divergent AAA domain protein n=1 Tax=candidate division TA06 bacterium ADurb.Bin131 TaxID=1852827 RepID=A0A1V6C969_UNCT6|nr:MAG: Divergent AAA domain protein [candidate division TA06 bacterium ADurb.Bin131]HRV05090.1 helix-turn-helix domain-containing protein [Candidatus Ratteibacteria bacterium]